MSPALTVAAETLERLVGEGEQRSAEGAAAQARIDAVSDATEALLREYRQAGKVLDGLRVYNDLLARQVEGQGREVADLRSAIDQVALIERQIVPLMARMIDSLEAFVDLDVPFLAQERHARVARLRELLVDGGVSVAEKFRKVLEAYQVENDYGRTIEAYRDRLEIDGRTREVDVLRIGRIGLYYLTPDAGRVGAWDSGARTWVALEPARYRATLAKGLRIARKQVAPDLLVLPVPAPELAP